MANSDRQREIKDFNIATSPLDVSYSDLIPVQSESGDAKAIPVGVLAELISDTLNPTPVSPSQYPDYLFLGSEHSLFVNSSHPSATDAKDNTGFSQSKPFRSIERALIEVARRSFVFSGADATARTSIFVSPGTYYVNNGYGGGGADTVFNRYQDGAKLVFLNKDWIVAGSYTVIESTYPTYASPQVLADLRRVINAVVEDLGSLGNSATLAITRSIRQATGEYSLDYVEENKRSAFIAALNKMAIDAQSAVINQGNVTDQLISLDTSQSPCQDVRTTIETLIDIVRTTLSGSSNSWSINLSRGTLRANFPEAGEPSALNLQGFNSPYNAGVIVPRGVSIHFMSLRTTIIRPTYVPPKTGGNEDRAAIFRLTGDSYIEGGTFLDKLGLAESHQRLHVFEYSTLQDLEDYYNKVAFVFQDEVLYSQLSQASELVGKNSDWIIASAKETTPVSTETEENKAIFSAVAASLVNSIERDLNKKTKTHSLKFAEDFLRDYVEGLSDADSGVLVDFALTFLDVVGSFLSLAILNEANVYAGGFKDSRISPSTEARDRALLLISIIKAVITGETEPEFVPRIFGISDVEVVDGENNIVGDSTGSSVEDSVQHSSAYIFSCSLRSEYGMCGVLIDGRKITGFKSFLAAQFTIISYQKDPSAFISSVGEGEVGNKRYLGTKSSDPDDLRHFGFQFRNESYGQLVSCFVVGSAVHYWARSGSSASVNNSVSNFGDVSMLAAGFRGIGESAGAFPQDTGYSWVSIIRPKPIARTGSAIQNIPVGTFVSRTTNSITLASPIDFNEISPYILRPGTKVYLTLLGTTNQEIYGVVGEPGLNSLSNQTITIPISSFSSNFPAVGTTPETTLVGGNVSIKRLADTRKLTDRVYRVKVVAPQGSRGKPIENFIFRLNYAVHGRQIGTGQNSTFYIADIETVGDNVHLLTLLEAWVDSDAGRDSLDSAYSKEIDLNYEPESSLINDNPSDNPSYRSMENLLIAIGVPPLTRADILSVADFEYQWSNPFTPYTVEFNRPSTLRGSHTWEEMGYYNPSTALPSVQNSLVGNGLTEIESQKKQVSKLFTEIRGGRVYTSGMDQDGNYYIGGTVFNTRTGEQKDLKKLGTSDSAIKTYEKLNIARKLNILPGAELRVQSGAKITLDAGAIITGIAAGEIGPKGDKGDKGDQGVQGIQGPQGLQGVPGPVGATGATGAQGLQGAQGPAGANGTNGSLRVVSLSSGSIGDYGLVVPARVSNTNFIGVGQTSRGYVRGAYVELTNAGTDLFAVGWTYRIKLLEMPFGVATTFGGFFQDDIFFEVQ